MRKKTVGAPIAAPGKIRQCRVCHCTDDRACVVAGVPCHWIAPDLCSACAPPMRAKAAKPAPSGGPGAAEKVAA